MSVDDQKGVSSEELAKAEAADLRMHALRMMRAAEGISPELPGVNELFQQRVKLHMSVDPMRGERIAEGISLAWAGCEHAASELRSHDGGTETEVYRCLDEFAAVLMQIDLKLKARSVFYC